MNALIQLGMTLFSGAAIWMVGRPEPWSRWGYLVGLVGQPFWFAAAVQSGQWGLFLITCWFTYAWGQGVWLRIVVPRREARAP
ncbi:hypothetical protein [Thioalbus denitrificans]|nr:hypothetical protein [Thioalbus denitrificans]